MSDAATLLPETLPPAQTRGRGPSVTERHLAILDRLAEAGLEIALALEAQAKGGAVVTEGDIAMAYNRVARAVRHTLMLRAKLADAMRDGETLEASRKAALRAGAARLVRGAIEDEAENDADRAERLGAGAAERLRAEDFGDLLSRPFDEAVASICRDLGLSPDWLTLAEDCLALEAELIRKPGKAAERPPPVEAGPLEVHWLESGVPQVSDSS